MVKGFRHILLYLFKHNAPVTGGDFLPLGELAGWTKPLVAATSKLSYRVFFFTAYSLGLRLGEGIALKVGDIDSVNMRVHIRDAKVNNKVNKDRLVPLPEKTLQVLRDFWSVHRHPCFLFPNRKRGLKNAHLVETPLDRGGIQSAMKVVVKQLGIKKNLMSFTASQLCDPFAGIRG